MLMQHKSVLVPAKTERDADLAEFGSLSTKTLAGFGGAACAAGNPDHELVTPSESAADTIANVLHWLAAHLDGDDGEVDGKVEAALDTALMNYRAEARGEEVP